MSMNRGIARWRVQGSDAIVVPMRDSTRDTIVRLKRLGESMGFAAHEEYTSPFLPSGTECAPRQDLAWCHRLGRATRSELSWALERDVPAEFPVVGFEVEGTSPTTKTMQVDALSLAASGIPIGVLMVADVRAVERESGKKTGVAGGEQNIYRRCARVIRSLRRSFGALRVVPADRSWLTDLGTGRAPARTPVPRARGRSTTLGSGGEGHGTAQVREAIRRRGEAAGLRVVQDWTPSEIDRAEQWLRDADASGMGLHDDPFSRKPVPRSDFLTRSKIDIVWMLPLPDGLRRFLAKLGDINPDLGPIYGVDPAAWDEIPILGFELETGDGKHASGGMMNLHAFCHFGVCVSLGDEGTKYLRWRLATLRSAFGLPRVLVQEARRWTP